MGDEDLPLFGYLEAKKDSAGIPYLGPPKNRGNPTGTLIVDVTGSDRNLIGSIENGLYEIPIREFYPHLDLEELLAFSAAQQMGRYRDHRNIQALIEKNMYHFFSEMMGIGIPWIRRHKDFSTDRREEQYSKLNPYKGKDLRARLRRVEKPARIKLKKALLEETRTHCFEKEYDRIKRERRGDNWGLRVMDFQQNAYPPSKRNGPVQFQRQWKTMITSFSREIARKLRNYPKQYYPIENQG